MNKSLFSSSIVTSLFFVSIAIAQTPGVDLSKWGQYQTGSDGSIWSSLLVGSFTLAQAESACAAIGGKIPTVDDFGRSTPAQLSKTLYSGAFLWSSTVGSDCPVNGIPVYPQSCGNVLLVEFLPGGNGLNVIPSAEGVNEAAQAVCIYRP